MINEELKEFMESLEVLGYEAYVVGGAVRDALKGLEARDYDLVTSAPVDVISDFRSLMSYGRSAEFGTSFMYLGGDVISIGTLKNDMGLVSESNPVTIEEDLKLRDFTVNALAMTSKGVIIDPFNGVRDLEGRVLRTVISPADAFAADPMRILRMCRLAVSRGFGIDEAVLSAAKEASSLLHVVSPVRLANEMHKVLMCGARSVEIMQDLISVGCAPHIAAKMEAASSVFMGAMMRPYTVLPKAD